MPGPSTLPVFMDRYVKLIMSLRSVSSKTMRPGGGRGFESADAEGYFVRECGKIVVAETKSHRESTNTRY